MEEKQVSAHVAGGMRQLGEQARSWLWRRGVELAIPLALVAVCGVATLATWSEQSLTGRALVEWTSREVQRLAKDTAGGMVVVAVPDTPTAATFAAQIVEAAPRNGAIRVEVVAGGPPVLRRGLEQAAERDERVVAVVVEKIAAGWPAVEIGLNAFSAGHRPVLVEPPVYRWATFLSLANLINVADQIAVIAIIAVGMTMVILSGGIDLSVGSLIALAGVSSALVIRDLGGGPGASTLAIIGGALAGVAVGATAGLTSGVLVAWARMPAFIATLGVMLIARGMAFLLTHGQSISELPDGFSWLGRGRTVAGIPNAVVLAAGLYVAGWFVLARTTFGRYLYAIGGAPEAARLAGVPIRRTLVAVYVISGALAGLGGVTVASQLKSGAPSTGEMKELYAIAAVVVGGTSLAGGEGTIVGTLVGALLLAVIENAMNLTGIESYTQKVVLGLVILAAVGLDALRRRGPA